MNINSNDPKWTAYVLGELSDVERADVERELESSAEAREIVDDIRMMTTMLKDEMANQPAVSLRPEQRAAIVPLFQPVQKASFWRRHWVFSSLAAASAAAIVLVGVWTPSMLRSRQAANEATVYGLSRAGDESAHAQPSGSSKPDATLPSVYSQAQVKAQASPTDAVTVSSRDLADADVRNKDAKLKKQSGDEEQLAAAITRQEAQAIGQTAASPPAPASPALQKELDALSPKSELRAAEAASFAAGKGGAAGGAFRTAIAPATPAPAPIIRADRPARPAFNTEAYDRIEDNPFKSVVDNPLATFSIDVDTAAYANMRRFLDQNQLPPKDAVRIEELINYFNYEYAQPTGSHPIGVYAEAASAPWKPDHRLVRIAVKARDIDINRRPPSNLVFLIDVSGSMEDPNKLPLLKSGLKLLVDKLGENDRVSIVVYAGNSGMVLPPTRGDRKEIIVQALDRLEAGGSTNGASGIQLAYSVAVSNFIKGGINRVILCTDGDFNVGVTNQGDLTRLIEDRAKSGVFLSVLGFGMGNLKDSTMEKLADKGNGNYAYIDSLNEARKVLVEEMAGTLMTVAKDVKIQVDFNPDQVNAYRLIGYENRVLRDQDFNDDTKDAGDMGAGQTVTVLFEIVPRGVEIGVPAVDPSKYRRPAPAAASAERNRRDASNELLTVRVRYKQPDGSDSTRFDIPLSDRGTSFESASPDYRFAAAIAEFGMILRDSPYKGSASMDHVIRTADRSRGSDRNGYRDEFIRLARRAGSLKEPR